MLSVGSGKPTPFLRTLTPPPPPPPPAPPVPSFRPTELSCRSLGLISGVHRFPRCTLTLRSWLHFRGRGGGPGPTAPSSALCPAAGKKPGRACQASGSRRQDPGVQILQPAIELCGFAGRWRPTTAPRLPPMPRRLLGPARLQVRSLASSAPEIFRVCTLRVSGLQEVFGVQFTVWNFGAGPCRRVPTSAPDHPRIIRLQGADSVGRKKGINARSTTDGKERVRKTHASARPPETLDEIRKLYYIIHPKCQGRSSWQLRKCLLNG